MIMKANKQIGFIYKNNESIDKILKDGDVVFERGFLREKTSTTLPINFGGIGKDLKDYKVYGNTYQNSTSGKNLFNAEIENGTYDGAGNPVSNSNRLRTATPIFLEAGIYTLSTKQSFRCIIWTSPTGERYTQLISSWTNIPYTFTLSTDNYIIIAFNRDNTSLNPSDLTEIQIEEGSVATDFEPYTGGQPSPNPNYPQEIKSCGDKSKNRFVGELYRAGATLLPTGGYSDNANYNIYKLSNVQVGQTYTFSENQTVANIETYTRALAFDSNNNFIELLYQENRTQKQRYSHTFSLPANTSYVLVSLRISDKEMQVEKGDTATPYEPYYEGYKIPVNVRSENLFDVNTIIPNTYITNAGATGSSQSTHLVDYIPAYKDKPIIVSYDYDTLVTTTNRSLVFYDTNKNYISGQYYSPIPKKHQFIPEQDGYIRFAYDKNCTNIYISYYNETTNIYLDEPLRKIDEYSDYIDFINGKVVRRIKEIILDGTTNVLSYYGKYGVDKAPLFYINKSDFILPIDYNQIIVASNCYRQFLIQSDRADTMFNYGIRGAISNHRIYLRDDRYESANDMNNWLSSNNVIVDYVLATPTEESITLPNIPTIDGNNTLNIETEITPSQVYIKYKSNE